MQNKIQNYFKNLINGTIKKIGIFDSGVGGMSIVNSLQNLPIEEIVYIADTAHIPYGNQTKKFIKQRCIELINILQTHNVDCIIIGCHTASAVVFPFLQKKFCDVPLIDVALPSIYETMLSGSSNVGITGTLMTINTHLHKTMLMKNNKNLNVIEQACPLLAESIENCDNKKIDRLLQRYLKPFLKNNVDTILLGCTHYIFAAKNFKKAFPYPIKLIDGRTFIHDKIKNFTQESSNNSIKNRLTVTVTGNQKSFEQSFKKYKVLSD